MLQNLKKECAIWEVFAIFLKVDNQVYKKKRIPAKSHVPKKTAIKQTIFIFK